MKYNININQVKCLEYELNLSQGALIDILLSLSTWAEGSSIDGEIWYYMSAGKMIDELPIIGNTKRCFQKIIITLKEKDLISSINQDNKTYYKLTDKGKSFNRAKDNRVRTKVRTSEEGANESSDRCEQKFAGGANESSDNNTTIYNTTNNILKENSEIVNNNEESITTKLDTTVNETHTQPNIVRHHMEIVNDYETLGTFNIEEIATKFVLNTYETPSLEKLAVSFFNYYVANKDKLEGKVNLKARFNKFIETDYHNLLRKKTTWPGIDFVTDEEFQALLDEGYFKNSKCSFYNDVVRKTLDTQGKHLFNLRIDFCRLQQCTTNKMAFNDWLIQEGRIIA